MVPEGVPAESDSSSLTISDRFSLYEVLTNRNTINWRRVDDRYLLYQTSDFQFTYFDSETKNQSYDFSGNLLLPGYPFNADSFGIEWSPVISYNKRPTGSAFHSMADFGPVLKSRFKGVPFQARAGIAGYGWNDNIHNGLFGTEFKDFDGDPGYYGGIRIGDFSSGIGGLPLHVNMQADGKYINNNGLGLLMGSALYRHALASGDSIFLFAGDSLLNGKDIYLRSNVGSGLYESSPWRIRHSLTASAGFKVAPRLGFEPAFFYSYGRSTVEYPKDSASLNNVKNSEHSLNLQMSSLGRYFFDYTGGIEFIWGNQDKLYKIVPSGPLLDTTEIPSQFYDYRCDEAATDHALRLNFPENISVDYEFHAVRESRKYPVLHLINGDSTANQDESDYVRLMHRAAINADSLSFFSVSLWGDYSKTYLYYYRRPNSGNSKQRDEYRIGVDASLIWEKIRIDERLFAESEVTEFKFKEVHLNDPPPYSRKFSSRLSGEWSITERLQLQISWYQVYYDNGWWYGREYFDTTSTQRANYYAINMKSNDCSINAALNVQLENLNFSFGTSVSDIFQRFYDEPSRSYQIKDYGKGYIFEPYLDFKYPFGFITAQGKIKRIINTLDTRRYVLKRNWDITLNAIAEFR
ncbi:MAG: hypothetical protein GX556_07245 [Fibrobacter sp.]|nr:hypothetical protein [Fibrobacter sp.]